MSGVSVLLMKALTQILSWLPKLDWADKIPVLDTVGGVMNIFAWVNVFIPAQLILALLALTALYYSFRVCLRLAYAIKNFIW